jgi:hypothetical protein
MGYLFVAVEGIADPSITAIGSSLIKAKGRVLYGINHPWRKEQYLVLVALIQMQGGGL